MTCGQCGLESKIEEAFIKVPRTGRMAFGRLCPTCWKRRYHRRFSASLWSTALLGAIGLLLVTTAPEVAPGWLLLNLTVFQLMLISTVVPHELGHVVAARALGLRVYQVIIGNGKVVFERRIVGFSLQVRSLPFGGFTIALPRSHRWYRLRILLMVLAGPLVNFLLAAAAWPWAFGDRGTQAFDSSLQPAAVFVVANLFVVVQNLWPHRFQSMFGLVANDGLLLLRTPFMSRKKILHGAPVQYCFYEGAEAQRRQDHDQARRWFERGLEHDADHWALRTSLATAWLQLGEVDLAREQFGQLLTRDDLKPAVKALLQNNLAYADALAALEGREELLGEADDLSVQALEAIPWNVHFKGTRGAVLIAQGSYDEGAKLLRAALAEHTEAVSKAANAYLLALTANRCGHKHEHDEYLALARTLDPNSKLQAFFPPAGLPSS